MPEMTLVVDGSQGAELKKAREDAGFTRREAARYVGITDAYLAMIENRNRNPSERVKRRINDLYDIDSRLFANDVGKRLRAQTRIYRMLMFFNRRVIMQDVTVWDYWMIDLTGRNVIFTDTMVRVSNADPHSTIKEFSFPYVDIIFDSNDLDDEATLSYEISNKS